MSPAASARRDNLDLFVQAVAEFQAVDGQVTLAALLAWLEAEDSYGQGLDVATPSEADSVKLLTVHRAKGLEWDVVFIPGVTERKFPTDRTRSTWLTVPFVMPGSLRGDARDRPALAGHTPDDIAAFRERDQGARAHRGAAARRTSRGPARGTGSRVIRLVLLARRSRPAAARRSTSRRRSEALAGLGRDARAVARPARQGRRPTPTPPSTPTCRGRCRTRRAEVARRHDGGGAGRRGRRGAGGGHAVGRRDRRHARARPDPGVGRRADPAGRGGDPRPVDRRSTYPCRRACPRPPWPGCATTPTAFAADLARPMPRQPSPAARFGTRFHAWVESRFGQQDLFDPDDLPGRGDAGIDDDADLAGADRDASRPGPFADRVPHAVEAPFALVLARPGRARPHRRGVRRARPDGDDWLVVDWKTNRAADSDPWQLALYRLAWAELTGVPLDRVRAQFYFVRSGELVEPRRPARPRRRCERGRLDRIAGPRVTPRRLRPADAAARAISTISPKVCSRSAAVVSSPVTMWSETVQIASARRPCLAASV